MGNSGQLRLLHAIGSVNPEVGGPVEALTRLGLVNRSRGHQIEIISLDDPISPWVATCPLCCHALGPGFSSYQWSPRFTQWIAENHCRFDAVIVHGIWHYNSFGTWRVLRKTKTPYFVYTHGMLDPWFQIRYPLKHLKKLLVWFWTDFRVLRDARAVLFTCEEEYRLSRRSFRLECQPVVVHYGTASPPSEEATHRENFLAKFPKLRGVRSFLFLGRIHEKKGIDLLLQAFAEVPQTWQLIMAGPNDSPYAQRMNCLVEELGVSDRVCWTGMLAGSMKWGAFYHADAFVLPSHQENFGIAVVEALACGLPVLISDKVNIWREILADSAGLVETDDLVGVTRLLRDWAQMPVQKQDAIRRSTRPCFERRFRVEAAASSLVQTIQQYGSDQASERRVK